MVALLVLLASCETTPPWQSSRSDTRLTSGDREEMEAADPYRPPAAAAASGAPTPALALAISKRSTGEITSQEKHPTRSDSDARPPISMPLPPSPADRRPVVGADVGQVLRVRTTAYCSDEHDHFTFGTMSALGTPLQSSGRVRSAAADWSEFPAGTTFRLVGHPEHFRIDDYGSALVGTRTIDLFFPNAIAMDEWGARKVEIEVLRWGSRQRSLEILKPRAGHDHIDNMIRRLESGLGR